MAASRSGDADPLELESASGGGEARLVPAAFDVDVDGSFCSSFFLQLDCLRLSLCAAISLVPPASSSESKLGLLKAGKPCPPSFQYGFNSRAHFDGSYESMCLRSSAFFALASGFSFENVGSDIPPIQSSRASGSFEAPGFFSTHSSAASSDSLLDADELSASLKCFRFLCFFFEIFSSADEESQSEPSLEEWRFFFFFFFSFLCFLEDFFAFLDFLGLASPLPDSPSIFSASEGNIHWSSPRNFFCNSLASRRLAFSSAWKV